MRIIIAGSRDMHDVIAREAVAEWFQDIHVGSTERIDFVILSGCSGVVDKLGIEWAKDFGYPCRRFPADWDKHGKAAGPIRNREMAQNADALILIWDGESKGSANMRAEAVAAGIPIYETIVKFKVTKPKQPVTEWL